MGLMVILPACPAFGRVRSAGQIAAFLGFMGAGMLGIGLAADVATMTAFAMIEQFEAGILIPVLVL